MRSKERKLSSIGFLCTNLGMDEISAFPCSDWGKKTRTDFDSIIKQQCEVGWMDGLMDGEESGLEQTAHRERERNGNIENIEMIS